MALAIRHLKTPIRIHMTTDLCIYSRGRVSTSLIAGKMPLIETSYTFPTIIHGKETSKVTPPANDLLTGESRAFINLSRVDGADQLPRVSLA